MEIEPYRIEVVRRLDARAEVYLGRFFAQRRAGELGGEEFREVVLKTLSVASDEKPIARTSKSPSSGCETKQLTPASASGSLSGER